MADPTTLEHSYARQLQDHLPSGRAWPRTPASTLYRLLLGKAGELARVHSRSLDLDRELDPRTTVELLPEWEAALGLPDECGGSGGLDARRGAVVARYLELGGQTPAYLVALAAAYGFTVTIVEHVPFCAGLSCAGDPLENPGDPFLAGENRAGDRLGLVLGWAFYFDVVAEEVNYQTFEAGRSTAGEPLATWGNDLLECVVRRAAPAHSIPRFSYTRVLRPDLGFATVSPFAATRT